MDSCGAGMGSCKRAIMDIESQAVSALLTKFLLLILVKYVIMYIICSIYDHCVSKKYPLVVLLELLAPTCYTEKNVPHDTSFHI